jgi:2-oxo-hept-3-ene-1,7-dioate hydratase
MSSLTAPQLEQLACQLLDAENSGRVMPRLSDLFPEMDAEEAYEVQRRVVAKKIEAGDTVRGYKIGLTSKVMQKAVGIDEPDYGRIFASQVYESGQSIALHGLNVPRIGVELAFILDRPLRGPGVSVSDVLAATRHVVPALELIASRTELPRKLVDTLADNAAGAGVIVGGRLVTPSEVDLRWLAAVLYKNADIVESGVSAAVMGHPAGGIAWLANRLGIRDVSLEPGQILLAGSFTSPVAVAPGDVLYADYGPLGGIAVTFSR